MGVFGRHSDQSVQYLHMPSTVSLMCRPKAFPPWAASTGQRSSCHCCSTCGARARLGQHHPGECGTGPAAHQAAWKAAGMPMPMSTVAEHSNGVLYACVSWPCWGAGVCNRQTTGSACRFVWNGGRDMYQCQRDISLQSACSRRQLANIWVAPSFSSAFLGDIEPSPIVHAELIVKTFLSL